MYKSTNNTIVSCAVWEIIDWLESVDTVCLDIETEGLNYLEDQIVAITLGNKSTQFLIPMTESTSEIYMLMCELSSKTIIGHNLLFDLPFIKYYMNCKVGTWNVIDTYQTECVLTKGMNFDRSYKNLVYTYTGNNISKELQTSFKFGQELSKEQIEYMVNDIIYLEDIVAGQQALEKDLCEELGIQEIGCIRLENRLTPILAEMCEEGICYDVEQHERNTEHFTQEHLRYLSNVYSFLEKIYIKYRLNEVEYSKDFKVKSKDDLRYINLNSPTQLLTLMQAIDPLIKNTRKQTLEKYSSYGTNADLKSLIHLLLKVKEYAKLVSTYGTTFLSTVNNGIIRTNIQQNISATGRLISSDISHKKTNKKTYVNLQNIPQKPEIRKCFVARPGYSMVTCDLSGAELRILASASNDPVLKAGVSGHLDLHSELATVSYRIITEDPGFTVSSTVNADKRSIHKRVLFGIIYGATDARIAEVLNIQRPIAKKVYKAIRERLVSALDYLESFVNQSMMNGIARANDVSNRLLILEEYNEHKKAGVYYHNRHRLVRQLFNLPMQSTNADMLKLCLIRLYEYFAYTIPEYDCKIRMTVYDEIVFEVPENTPEIAEAAKRIIINAANEFLTNDVEMECSMHINKTWIK